MTKAFLALALLFILTGCANQEVIASNNQNENLKSTTHIGDEYQNDDDKDGVSNTNDKCPDTKDILKVDQDGCSLYQIDKDHDGVANSYDKCTQTPKELSVNSIGCQNDFKGINFKFDKSNLLPSGIKALDKLIAYLNKYPEYDARILGNTDSISSRKYNQALAQRRANSAMKYLLTNKIPKNRLKTITLGEDAPIKFNDLEEGRSTNRRVDIIIIDPKK